MWHCKPEAAMMEIILVKDSAEVGSDTTKPLCTVGAQLYLSTHLRPGLSCSGWCADQTSFLSGACTHYHGGEVSQRNVGSRTTVQFRLKSKRKSVNDSWEPVQNILVMCPVMWDSRAYNPTSQDTYPM